MWPFTYFEIRDWLNQNQGVVSVLLFVVTLLFAWISGIFTVLRRKPKFKIELIDGPTCVCTFLLGRKHHDYDVHCTAIALYLMVTNVGSAASSIRNVSVAYHWHPVTNPVKWLRYCVGWAWIHNQAVALTDFQVWIGQNIKVYPFLTQKNSLSPASNNTYLETGYSTNGVVYFEQSGGWGAAFPSVKNNFTRLKVGVRDSFGKLHTAKFYVPVVSLEEARKYNPSFGKTLSENNGEPLPQDVKENELPVLSAVRRLRKQRKRMR